MRHRQRDKPRRGAASHLLGGGVSGNLSPPETPAQSASCPPPSPPNSAAQVGSGVGHGLRPHLQEPRPHVVGQVARPCLRHWLTGRAPQIHPGPDRVGPRSQLPLPEPSMDAPPLLRPSFFKSLPSPSLINPPVYLLLFITRCPLLGAWGPYRSAEMLAAPRCTASPRRLAFLGRPSMRLTSACHGRRGRLPSHIPAPPHPMQIQRPPPILVAAGGPRALVHLPDPSSSGNLGCSPGAAERGRCGGGGGPGACCCSSPARGAQDLPTVLSLAPASPSPVGRRVLLDLYVCSQGSAAEVIAGH